MDSVFRIFSSTSAFKYTRFITFTQCYCSYSYVDANGDVRKTEYKAGPGGYQPTGDISVDKKTAEKAAELATFIPKEPVEEKVDVKIPFSPFRFPLYALPGIHTPALPAALPFPYAVRQPLSFPLSYGATVQLW